MASNCLAEARHRAVIGEYMSKKKPAAPEILNPSRIREGQPFPLGATWDGLGVNFAIFSANATKVELDRKSVV